MGVALNELAERFATQSFLNYQHQLVEIGSPHFGR